MGENAAVEIHDSTLERIESGSDSLLAVISAYVHRSYGRPGIDAGTGWSQMLHVRFHRGQATGRVDMVPLELLDGQLEASGEKFENEIPVPLDRSGAVRLELRGRNDSCIIIVGDRIEANLVGPAEYIEDFEAVKDAER